MYDAKLWNNAVPLPLAKGQDRDKASPIARKWVSGLKNAIPVKLKNAPTYRSHSLRFRSVCIRQRKQTCPESYRLEMRQYSGPP
jgi:hypothetical protein